MEYWNIGMMEDGNDGMMALRQELRVKMMEIGNLYLDFGFLKLVIEIRPRPVMMGSKDAMIASLCGCGTIVQIAIETAQGHKWNIGYWIWNPALAKNYRK